MARRRIYFTFDFVETEEVAQALCKSIVTTYTPYMKSNYDPPKYRPWTSKDGKEHKYLVTYYYHA